jgi:EpsI family protein
MVGTFYLLRRWPFEQRCAVPNSVVSPSLLTVTAAALILQVLYLNSAKLPEARLELAVSHFQGDWDGIDLPLSDAAEQIIGRSRIISRRYRHGDDWVELLLSSTGGDRRRAHAPEYCLTGSGWRVYDRVREQLELPDGPVEVHMLSLRRQGYTDRVLAYWFTDGQRNWDSFPRMLAEDTWRRLRGEVTDWHVVRLIAENPNDLFAFARQLHFSH